MGAFPDSWWRCELKGVHQIHGVGVHLQEPGTGKCNPFSTASCSLISVSSTVTKERWECQVRSAPNCCYTSCQKEVEALLPFSTIVAAQYTHPSGPNKLIHWGGGDGEQAWEVHLCCNCKIPHSIAAVKNVHEKQFWVDHPAGLWLLILNPFSFCYCHWSICSLFIVVIDFIIYIDYSSYSKY
jgi:hypothetical protein